jgi:hypothetical protein
MDDVPGSGVRTFTLAIDGAHFPGNHIEFF